MQRLQSKRIIVFDDNSKRETVLHNGTDFDPAPTLLFYLRILMSLCFLPPKKILGKSNK